MRVTSGGSTSRAGRILAKSAVNLRLDAKVLAHLRASGPGWQTRVNAALARLIEERRL